MKKTIIETVLSTKPDKSKNSLTVQSNVFCKFHRAINYKKDPVLQNLLSAQYNFLPSPSL